MYYSLRGKLIFSDETSFAIECGGVGYLCFSTANTLKRLPKNGEEAFVFTYLNVREDAMDLFGFHDKKELECFKQLISVSGVGPKAALAILSRLSPEALAASVAVGDVKSITQAQGVGPKLAQRVVLELKNKLKIDLEEAVGILKEEDVVSSQSAGNIGEASAALVSLGYTRSEAQNALKGADASLSTEELIKIGLKKLMS